MTICFIGGVSQENHRPATSLRQTLSHNVGSSNKGVLIADININFNNITPIVSRGIEIGSSFSPVGYISSKRGVGLLSHVSYVVGCFISGFHGIIPSSLELKSDISFDFNLTKKYKKNKKKFYELMKFLIQTPYNISRNIKYLLTAG
jgi:hypothetical protein